MRRRHVVVVGGFARACARSSSVETLEDRRLFAGVVISEFLASNVNGITDVDGAHSDWIELYNSTGSTVALDGWSLTDDATNTAKWQFPNNDPNSTEFPLPAGGRLVVFASSKDRRVPGQELHTNFALGKGGEYLGLFPPGSSTAESDYAPAFPAQNDDISYGVLDSDDTKQTFFNPPTPGAANSTAVSFAAEPEFSALRGFYSSSFQLALSSDTSGASIRYTTDGTPPTPTTGTLYTSAININGTTNVRAIAYKAGLNPSTVETQSYIFLSQVIQQPLNVAGWPRPTINIGGTATRVHDYEMDPEIVNNPAYSADLIKGLTDIPTMSLTVKESDMWDPATGEGGFYRLDDVEAPVSVEMLYPKDPSKNQQIDAGIEGHSHDRMKRSMRLTFRSDYGASEWKTPLMQDAVLNGANASDGVERLVLRAGNNRSFARGDNPDQTTYTEDQWVRDTQLALNGGTQGTRGTYVHLYINGLYWGLYNPTERPDDHHAARYFGGDNDDWTVVNDGGINDGDPARYNYLIGALKDKNMATLANYNELNQYLDTTSFVDYLLTQWYAGVTDWPYNNFWAGMRNDVPGPLRYFSWDGEWSFGIGTGILDSPDQAWVHPDFLASETKNEHTAIPNLFNSAKASPEFKILVADRAYKATANGGALTDTAAKSRWDALTNSIQDAVVAESARWGDAATTSSPRTRDGDWQTEVNRIRNYMTGNGADLISAMRAQGYYPSNNPATFSQRGGTVAAGFKLTLNNPNSGGTIYYTLDGSDPRAVGGGIAGTAYSAANGITLNQNATVRVRVRSSSGEWSASDQVAFTVTGQPPTGSQATVRAIADATVRDGSFANTNFGTATTLEDKTNAAAGYTRWTYLRFDIASFSSITGATLRLFGKSNTTGQNVTVNVYGSTNTTWSETGITWNNKPASNTNALGSKTITSTAQLHTFDVGAYVAQQRAAGATAVTFVIKANTTAAALAAFNSDEASASRPELLVTYNGSNPSVPTTLRSTADTYVRDGGSAGLNFGSSGTLELKKDATGYNREIWLKFDLSSVSSISTGKLRLYGKIDSATQSPLVSVYSSSGTSWTETGLTFNNRPAAGTAALASTTISTSAFKYYEWDVTNYLKSEKAAGRNVVTLVLRSQTITAPQLFFNSDEAASNQPQLQITP